MLNRVAMDAARMVAIALALCVMASATAQSINVDFGNGRGTPAKAYAAAGLPGMWNVITAPGQFPPEPIGPVALVEINGEPTVATLHVDIPFGTLPDIPIAHDDLGEHHALLGDGVLGAFGPKIPVTFTIEGIENGTYRLIVYAWYWPVVNFAQGTLLTDPPFLFYLPTGGPWQGDLALGVTHMDHIAHVTNNRIEFFVVGDGQGGFFNGDIYVNGLQLWKIEPLQVDPKNVCGGASLGSCLEANGHAACSDGFCCTAVCQYDPYCCNVEWDHLCAGLANASVVCDGGIHPNCLGHDLAGDCHVGGTTPGCDDPACCDAVYAVAQGCVWFAWDNACAQLADLFCSDEPPGCGHSASQSCFQVVNPPTITPYCDDAACCETVCSIDAFCCDVSFDFICAQLAHSVCENGACCDGEGSCFEGHPWGGCDDPACCRTVCLEFPPCCMDPQPQTNFGWTNSCVQLAQELCSGGPPPRASADLNGDGLVNVADLLLLLAHWGPCPPGCHCPADLDGSDSVNVSDLLILLANWG